MSVNSRTADRITVVTIDRPARRNAVDLSTALALWCDLRVAGRSAKMGVFNRRFGVPSVDLGTIRLPRIVGQGRALDVVFGERLASPESREAAAAFMARRPADFSGFE